MSAPINFNQAMAAAFKDIEKNVALQLKSETMKRVATMSEVTIRREMRRSGMMRSTETGSHDRRSRSQKEKVSSEGSIFDVESKVEDYDDAEIAFAGQASHKGSYRARFQGDGTETHYLWDSTKTVTMDPSPNHEGTSFLQNAVAVIKRDAKSMIEKGLKRALLKVKKQKVRSR